MDTIKFTEISGWVLRIGAISNVLVTVPAFLVYDAYIDLLLDQAPDTPWLVWIWSGMAFLWGVMMWDLSGNLGAKWPLLRYLIAEKAVTSASAVVGFLIGDLPGRALAALVVTDVIWIPLFAMILEGARTRFAAGGEDSR
ncbi:MAG: hypothetical protein WA797_09550 [Acidimicrobiales bacterium]